MSTDTTIAAENTENKDEKYGKKEEGDSKPVVETEKIHSANAWEAADLGDQNRKNKFLRLMGAAKKEHHGKIIIGDHNPTHGRSKKDTEEVNKELEEQYQHSLEHRLVKKRHGGLGFHDEEKKPEETEKKSDPDKPSSTEEAREELEEEKDTTELGEIKDNEEKDGRPSLAKKMKFVKASS